MGGGGGEVDDGGTFSSCSSSSAFLVMDRGSISVPKCPLTTTSTTANCLPLHNHQQTPSLRWPYVRSQPQGPANTLCPLGQAYRDMARLVCSGEGTVWGVWGRRVGVEGVGTEEEEWGREGAGGGWSRKGGVGIYRRSGGRRNDWERERGDRRGSGVGDEESGDRQEWGGR